MNQSDGLEYLRMNGINLYHVFDTSSIADLLVPAVPDLRLEDYPSAVLIANAGYELWHSLESFGMYGNDPVDNFSLHLATTYAKDYLNSEAMILYPSSYPISLRAIGERTGWSFTTPMGISIHPKFGTWFAYRSIFLLEKQLPATKPDQADHPCHSCLDKPCQTVCPSGAVRDIGAFGLDECARFRLQDSSPCAYSCFSRIACPVGSEYRYVPDQMKYHYKRSRESMARHYSLNPKIS